jgi:hypothetical protein
MSPSPGVHLKLSRISLAANNLSYSFLSFGKPSSLEGFLKAASALSVHFFPF